MKFSSWLAQERLLRDHDPTGGGVTKQEHLPVQIEKEELAGGSVLDAGCGVGDGGTPPPPTRSTTNTTRTALSHICRPTRTSQTPQFLTRLTGGKETRNQRSLHDTHRNADL